MQKSLRRWTAGIVVAGAAVLIPAATAWACLGLAGITTSSAHLQAGGTVTVNGVEFGKNPVQLHLDAINGPVLASVTPDSSSSTFAQPITLPADLAAGQHVLVATEPAVTADGKNNGAANGTPARTVVQVGTAPGASPAAPARPVALTSQSGTSDGTLALIGVAAAAAALFLAGSVSMIASRRGRPQAERVKAP